jgi:hypothetical protein
LGWSVVAYASSLEAYGAGTRNKVSARMVLDQLTRQRRFLEARLPEGEPHIRSSLHDAGRLDGGSQNPERFLEAGRYVQQASTD